LATADILPRDQAPFNRTAANFNSAGIKTINVEDEATKSSVSGFGLPASRFNTFNKASISKKVKTIYRDQTPITLKNTNFMISGNNFNPKLQTKKKRGDNSKSPTSPHAENILTVNERVKRIQLNQQSQGSQWENATLRMSSEHKLKNRL